jgi:HD-like signal output (HDOD) protein
MSSGKSLIDSINEHLASENLQLPVYSPIASKLQGLVQQPEASAEQIERLLVRDPGVASQVLKVANSSFYAGLNKVSTIRAAIMRLGLTQVVNIAVLVTQRGAYGSNDRLIAAYMATLWKHAMGCAFGSKWLAEKCGYRELASEAFMAGLFHDIGELLLLKVIEELRKEDLREGGGQQPLPDGVVKEVLDAMHTVQGHQLISLWGLPETYGQVARAHHDEEPDAGNMLALIVRLVDRTCSKLGFALDADLGIALTACPETALLGVKEVTLAELEIALEDGLTRVG